MPQLKINGKEIDVNAPPDMPLLWVIRDQAGLTGTKFGCGIAACGACTVIADGAAIRSCVTPFGSIGTQVEHPACLAESGSSTPRHLSSAPRRAAGLWLSSARSAMQLLVNRKDGLPG
jgi:isoquinoline 1-oxidoreductase subunit alpha